MSKFHIVGNQMQRLIFCLILIYILVPCPAVENPVNGTVMLDTDGYISTANYRCNEGHTLKGIQQSVCSSTGEWNIEPPICGMC